MSYVTALVVGKMHWLQQLLGFAGRVIRSVSPVFLGLLVQIQQLGLQLAAERRQCVPDVVGQLLWTHEASEMKHIIITWESISRCMLLASWLFSDSPKKKTVHFSVIVDNVWHSRDNEECLSEWNYKLLGAELERVSAFSTYWHPRWCATHNGRGRKNKKHGHHLINDVHVEKRREQIYDHLVEHSLQSGGAHFFSHVPVWWVGQEELPLGLQRGLDVFPPIDVLLTAIHHSDITWESINVDTNGET